MLRSFAGQVRGLLRPRGNGDVRNKLNIIVPVLGVTIALIEPAFAATAVPGPIIGAGLPALAILGGGYWLVKKLRGPR